MSLRIALALSLLLGAMGSASSVAALALPAGFSDALVAAVPSPTALAFTPDGRLLAATQPGQLRVYGQDGTLLRVGLDLGSQVCSNFERGLLGVAVDPGFAANRRIYLYYTFNKNNTCPNSTVVNRVSRFTLQDDNAVVGETVLVDNIPSINGNHNAGDLHFGADGKLYISVGDSGTGGANARTRANLAGKILRVNTDGTAPADNPFAAEAGARRCGDPAGSPGSGNCQEIFAFGLRNPFRFAFRPGTSQFFIDDVGQNTWEEIDQGQAGADYGWNVREGPCPYANTGCNPATSMPSGYADPIHFYNHSTGCYSITGGAFVPLGLWPAPYDGAYLYADYGCGKIRFLDPASPAAAADFATGLGGSSAVTLAFGPYGATQALYYTTYAGGGQVRRIAYAGPNHPPTAAASADPLYSAGSPLVTTLSAAGSADPDPSDSLTYMWDFGDGSAVFTTTALTVGHSYSAAVPKAFTATLTARDSLGAVSAPATVRVFVNDTPPVPAITSPAEGATFTVGQSVGLQGAASSGSGPTTLMWDALLHHVNEASPGNAHTHPLLSAVAGGSASLLGPAPEDFGATALSFVEVRLTATDSLGLSATVTRTLTPARVTLGFASAPSGITLRANEARVTTPGTLTAWQGQAVQLEGRNPQLSGGRWWIFGQWSDGGAGAHTVLAPAAPTTYTLTLAPGYVAWLPEVFR